MCISVDPDMTIIGSVRGMADLLALTKALSTHQGEDDPHSKCVGGSYTDHISQRSRGVTLNTQGGIPQGTTNAHPVCVCM